MHRPKKQPDKADSQDARKLNQVKSEQEPGMQIQGLQGQNQNLELTPHLQTLPKLVDRVNSKEQIKQREKAVRVQQDTIPSTKLMSSNQNRELLILEGNENGALTQMSSMSQNMVTKETIHDDRDLGLLPKMQPTIESRNQKYKSIYPKNVHTDFTTTRTDDNFLAQINQRSNSQVAGLRSPIRSKLGHQHRDSFGSLKKSLNALKVNASSGTRPTRVQVQQRTKFKQHIEEIQRQRFVDGRQRNGSFSSQELMEIKQVFKQHKVTASQLFEAGRRKDSQVQREKRNLNDLISSKSITSLRVPSDTDITHGRSADRIIKKSPIQGCKQSQRARQSMVILKKLQDFIGNKEKNDLKRFSTKRKAQEKSMVAFGQEIESIMSGKRAGSQSGSEKSKENNQDTEEEPSNADVQPVAQKQISFQVAVEGTAESTILIPKVLCKKKKNSLKQNSTDQNSEKNEIPNSYSFMQSRQLAGFAQTTVRFKDDQNSKEKAECKCQITEGSTNGQLPSVERSNVNNSMSPKKSPQRLQKKYHSRTSHQSKERLVSIEAQSKLKEKNTRTIEIIGKQGQAIHLPNDFTSPLASVYQTRAEWSDAGTQKLPQVGSSIELSLTRRNNGQSPSGTLKSYELSELQIIGNKKSAMPAINSKAANQAIQKNRRYFNETLPAKNADIISCQNLESNLRMTADGIQIFESSQTSSFDNRQPLHNQTLHGKSMHEMSMKQRIQFKNAQDAPISAFSDYNGDEHLRIQENGAVRMSVNPSMYNTANQIKIAEKTNSEETESARSQMALKPKSILKGGSSNVFDKSNYDLEELSGAYNLNVSGNQLRKPGQMKEVEHLELAPLKTEQKQLDKFKSSNIKIRMNEAKNKQMATHIIPNARIKDLKKMNATEMRKTQFPGSVPSEAYATEGFELERQKFILKGRASQQSQKSKPDAGAAKSVSSIQLNAILRDGSNQSLIGQREIQTVTTIEEFDNDSNSMIVLGQNSHKGEKKVIPEHAYEATENSMPVRQPIRDINVSGQQISSESQNIKSFLIRFLRKFNRH